MQDNTTLSTPPCPESSTCSCGCGKTTSPGKKYYVGHHGHHQSPYPPTPERLTAQTSFGEGESCHNFTGHRDDRGYGRIYHNGKQLLAHRVAWELAYGPIPKGIEVCHHCDNTSCVRLSHLFLGTRRDNAMDMMDKGRGRYITHEGETSGMAKLTDDAVRDIRARAPYTKKTILAEEYGVSPSNIGFVVNRQTWKHVS